MIFSVLLLQNFVEHDVWGNLHWCPQVWSFILGFRLTSSCPSEVRAVFWHGYALRLLIFLLPPPEVSGVHQHAWFMWHWASNLGFFIVTVRALAIQPHANPPQHLKKKLPLRRSASLQNCWRQLGASHKSGCSNVKKETTKVLFYSLISFDILETPHFNTIAKLATFHQSFGIWQRVSSQPSLSRCYDNRLNIPVLHLWNKLGHIQSSFPKANFFPLREEKSFSFRDTEHEMWEA